MVFRVTTNELYDGVYNLTFYIAGFRLLQTP